MRIIAGEWKGRRIAAPKGAAVRPTLDRVREAWMSIVQVELPGARVADLFAGSGALGLEALSRGAEHVDFVENDPRTIRVLKENIALLSAESRCTIHPTDALQFVSRPPFHVAARVTPHVPSGSSPPVAVHVTPHVPSGSSPPVAVRGTPHDSPPAFRVVFADPPYRLGLATKLAQRWLERPFSTIFGIEHEATEQLPDGGDCRRYGDTAITFYRS